MVPRVRDNYFLLAPPHASTACMNAEEGQQTRHSTHYYLGHNKSANGEIEYCTVIQQV